MSNAPKNLTIAATGASGAIFLRHLLQAVERDERVQTVNFIASDSALRVMAEELDLRGRDNLVRQLLGTKSPKIQQQANADIGANVASEKLNIGVRIRNKEGVKIYSWGTLNQDMSRMSAGSSSPLPQRNGFRASPRRSAPSRRATSPSGSASSPRATSESR